MKKGFAIQIKLLLCILLQKSFYLLMVSLLQITIIIFIIHTLLLLATLEEADLIHWSDVS